MTGGAKPLSRPDSGVVDALRPSPNHGERVGRGAPDCLVLHYTGMASGEAAIRRLCDPASSVSCHYVVEEDGTVLQLVAEHRRAWHAGQSHWAGETDLNSASIGIEIVNPGHVGGLPPFPSVQIGAVIRLGCDIARRHAIAPARVLAHSDIAPGRKEDPGERFPWATLAQEGLGLWVEPGCPVDTAVLEEGSTGPAVAVLQGWLAAFGYGAPDHGRYDAATACVVRAFQRRFRPARIDGRADPGTRQTLRDLLTLRDGAPPAGA